MVDQRNVTHASDLTSPNVQNPPNAAVANAPIVQNPSGVQNPQMKYEGPERVGIPMSGIEYDPSDPRTATLRDQPANGQQYYQNKPVTLVRSVAKGDSAFNPEKDLIVVRLADGTEKVLMRTDITWPAKDAPAAPRS